MLPYPGHLGIGRAGERTYRTPVFRCPVLRATSGENTVSWHPRQLRAFMKRDPRDLLGEFRALAHSGRRSCCNAGASGGSRWPPRCSPSPSSPCLSACRPLSRSGSGRLRPQLRHRPLDDPQRPGCPASPRSPRAGASAARTSPAGRSACGWTPTAPEREPSPSPRPPPATPPAPSRFLRPARHTAVRASAEPGAAVHRPPFLHLPRRLRQLPVRLRARRIPHTGRCRRQRALIPAPADARPFHPEHRRPCPVRARCPVPGMSREDRTKHKETSSSLPHSRLGTLVTAWRGCHGWMSTGHKARRGRLGRAAVTPMGGRSGARSIASRSASIAANISARHCLTLPAHGA